MSRAKFKEGIMLCGPNWKGAKTCKACPYYEYDMRCRDRLAVDGLAIIEQLEMENEALLRDLWEADCCDCTHCRHYRDEQSPCSCDCDKCEETCACRDCRDNSNWEWRGVQKEAAL